MYIKGFLMYIKNRYTLRKLKGGNMQIKIISALCSVVVLFGVYEFGMLNGENLVLSKPPAFIYETTS